MERAVGEEEEYRWALCTCFCKLPVSLGPQGQIANTPSLSFFDCFSLSIIISSPFGPKTFFSFF